MALLNNNLSGVAMITNPGGLIATPYNFITLYDYATQFAPHLIKDLFYANGTGDITGLLELIGNVGNYDSDEIQWSELGRLHGKFSATVSTNTFTSTTPHNLRVGDEFLVVDATANKESIGTVTAITSSTVFTALNKDGANWSAFTGTLSISGDFTNSFPKGSDPFPDGKKWDPNFKENFTHIVKETYEVPNSDRIHASWIETPNGPMWFSTEIERTRTLFRNKETLTHLFNKRNTTSASAAAGNEPGMKGIVQQLEMGGNLFNGYITAKSDLEAIALRSIQQNPDITELMVLCDMTQMNHFNTIMSTLSSGVVGAPHYGSFNNDQDMCLKLDFRSVWLSGITFHFKHLRVLDDPTVYSFNTAGINYLIVPGGKKEVTENGKRVKKPYLSTLYRNGNGINRREEVKLFGPGGTQLSKDVSRWEFLTETTNAVVGANSWFLGRKLSNHYSVG
jgi:hypothetical protein